eukprot:9483004-Ditylum_brightwellii.AAC.1
MQYVMNANVNKTNENLVQNIKNVTCCMHAILTSQVRMRGCAKALLEPSRSKSQAGFNPVGWMTARQQPDDGQTDKPSRMEHYAHAHACKC